MSHGFITNVLHNDVSWKRHSNFLVFEALDYLVVRRKEKSEIGSQGYFAVQTIIDHLNRIGFAPDDTKSALTFLLKRNLIVADHMGKSWLNEKDYVRAHASGFVHARLLPEKIHYVAGIAPATYFNDRKKAEQIGRLANINPGFTDISFPRKKEMVFIVLEHLKNEYARHTEESPLFGQEAKGSRFLLRMIESSLNARSIGFGTSVTPTLFD
jgi:hypothetical protein